MPLPADEDRGGLLEPVQGLFIGIEFRDFHPVDGRLPLPGLAEFVLFHLADEGDPVPLKTPVGQVYLLLTQYRVEVAATNQHIGRQVTAGKLEQQSDRWVVPPAPE